ncbi:MAG: YveK family protein [Desulfitobacterium sp.]
MEEGIDLRQYLKILRKRWKIVLALPLIAAIISGAISFYVLIPVYQASTTLIVGEKTTGMMQDEGRNIDYDVLLANQQLTKTYSAIAQSRTVKQNALTELNLPLGVEELGTMISVKPVPNTEILEIQVKHSSPELAASIANTVAREFSKTVIEIKKVDSVSIVDRAVIPERPIAPRKSLNVLIAFVVGLMASLGLALLLEAMDNTIMSTEDVEKFLGIPVLGSIPQG